MSSTLPLTASSRLPLISGHSIPLIGLGTWRAHLSGTGIVRAAVKAALLAGYRHLDCAWTCENEGEVGDGIRDAIDATASSPHPLTRAELFLTSNMDYFLTKPLKKRDLETTLKKIVSAGFR